MTDWRSRLSEETLDYLLRISIDGPPLSKFDSNPAVEQHTSSDQMPLHMAHKNEAILYLKLNWILKWILIDALMMYCNMCIMHTIKCFIMIILS